MFNFLVVVCQHFNWKAIETQRFKGQTSWIFSRLDKCFSLFCVSIVFGHSCWPTTATATTAEQQKEWNFPLIILFLWHFSHSLFIRLYFECSFRLNWATQRNESELTEYWLGLIVWPAYFHSLAWSVMRACFRLLQRYDKVFHPTWTPMNYPPLAVLNVPADWVLVWNAGAKTQNFPPASIKEFCYRSCCFVVVKVYWLLWHTHTHKSFAHWFEVGSANDVYESTPVVFLFRSDW